MNKIALVTGTTAGFGKAIAELLSKNNYNLIITGRRENLLSELETSITSSTTSKVISLCFDVRSNDEVCKAIDSLPEEWRNIDLLVNNAGLAVGVSPIQDGVIDDWERMIDTNIKGLLYVTRKVSPLMIKNNSGHIVNIGSIAGKEVYANGNVYCGTKHAVDALSQGMRIDMLKHNIKVTAIHPGMAETEFSLVRFKGDSENAEKVYDGLIPLYAEDIAEALLFVVSRPQHVNINDLIIMPTAQANTSHIKREL